MDAGGQDEDGVDQRGEVWDPCQNWGYLSRSLKIYDIVERNNFVIYGNGISWFLIYHLCKIIGQKPLLIFNGHLKCKMKKNNKSMFPKISKDFFQI